MPDAPGLELISQQINEAHTGAVLETSFEHDAAVLIVDSKQILEVLTWLRETPGQEYSFLCSVHAADYLPAEPRFGVHYELLNMDRVERISVKALLADPAKKNGAPHPRTRSGGDGGNGEAVNLPTLDSCTEMFPTANVQEREVYDMFGISFRGHPDLTRILLPDDYVGWPQRRDFPVGGEPVLFTKDEPENPGWWE